MGLKHFLGRANKIHNALWHPADSALRKAGASTAQRSILDPIGPAVDRASSSLASGENKGKSYRDIGDPGFFLHDSQLDQDQQAADDAAALEREQMAVDNSATDAANKRLLARRRRLAGSQLATGAVGGGGALAAPSAYGASSLGG